MKLNNKILEFRRRQLGWSVEFLAKMLGVSNSTIRKIEAGKTNTINTDILGRLQFALDLSDREMYLMDEEADRISKYDATTISKMMRLGSPHVKRKKTTEKRSLTMELLKREIDRLDRAVLTDMAKKQIQYEFNRMEQEKGQNLSDAHAIKDREVLRMFFNALEEIEEEEKEREREKERRFLHGEKSNNLLPAE